MRGSGPITELGWVKPKQPRIIFDAFLKITLFALESYFVTFCYCLIILRCRFPLCFTCVAAAVLGVVVYFPAWGLWSALVKSFSSLARGYVYALGLGFKFSRAWSRWEIFPRSFDNNIFAGLSLISLGLGYHVKELLRLVGLWPKLNFTVIASYSSDSFSHWVTQPNSTMFYIAVILLLQRWESQCVTNFPLMNLCSNRVVLTDFQAVCQVKGGVNSGGVSFLLKVGSVILFWSSSLGNHFMCIWFRAATKIDKMYDWKQAMCVTRNVTSVTIVGNGSPFNLL